MKILLIGCDSSVCDSVREICATRGDRVQVANVEGEVSGEAFVPNLLILDANAAGAAFDAARDMQAGGAIPVALVADGTAALSFDRLQSIAPQAYLMTPIQAPDLLALLERIGRETFAQNGTSYEQLMDLVENANDLIQQVDGQGRIVFVNRCWLETMEYSHEEVNGLTLQDLVHPEDLPHCFEAFKQILQGMDVGAIETRFLTKSGKAVWLEGHNNCHFVNGQPTLTRGIFRNVTDARRKNMIQRLEDGLRQVIWQMDRPTDISMGLSLLYQGLRELEFRFNECSVNVVSHTANKAGQREFNILGLKKGEDGDTQFYSYSCGPYDNYENPLFDWIDRSEPVYRPDLDVDDPYDEKGRVGDGGQAIRCVLDIPFSTGSVAINSVEPNAFTEEQIDILMRIARVIAQMLVRHEDLASRARTEQMYRSLLEVGDIVTLSLNKSGDVVFTTDNIEGVTGIAAKNFYQDSSLFSSLIDEDMMPMIRQCLASAWEGTESEHIEFRITRRDGEQRWIMGAFVPFCRYDDQIEMVQFTAVDISDQKNAERILADANCILEQQVAERTREIELRERWNKLLNEVAILANHSPDPERLTRHALCRICAELEWNVGVSYVCTEEGDLDLEQVQYASRADSERWDAHIQSWNRNHLYSDEGILHRAMRQKKCVVSLSAESRSSDNIERTIAKCGLHCVLVCPVVHGDHVASFLVLMGVNPSKWDDNALNVTQQVGLLLGALVERRVRLEAEERQKVFEQSLVQAERMATVGTVAAGIVHNLRGPLQGIIGYSGILQLQHPEIENIERIVESGQQMSDMINEILKKSRNAQTPVTIDINELLRSELSFFDANMFFKHEVVRVIDLSEGPLHVSGVYPEFSQVFGNLLRNAIDAMAGCEEKRLTISSKRQGDHIVVEVSDTGCGMSEEIIANLYEPFFTTKNGEDGAEMGTGLGMYTIKKLLDASGNRVEVDSAVDEGTTFRVYIAAQDSSE